MRIPQIIAVVTFLLLVIAVVCATFGKSNSARKGYECYRGLEINTAENTGRALPFQLNLHHDGLTWCDIWQPFDQGRMTDEVWIRKEKIVDWYDFLDLGEELGSRLILKRRYQPETPKGNPWTTFGLAVNADGSMYQGERPVELPLSDFQMSKVEATYVMLVFDTKEFLQLAYEPDGKMGKCELHLNGSAQYFYGWENLELNLHCKLPQKFISSADFLSCDAIQKLRISHESSTRLKSVWCIRQTNQSHCFYVEIFDPTGKQLSAKFFQYRHRPYDRQMSEHFKV